MSRFREIMEEYGVDYEVTMTRFMGNEQLYLRLLDMLFQDKNLLELGDALAADDMTRAFEAAHTLKGVVGNMGLSPLYGAVCAIVEPLRTENRNEDYQALYQAISTEFARADVLRHALNEGVLA